MKTGAVVPVGAGRVENLKLVLQSIASQTLKPEVVVLVCDGPEAGVEIGDTTIPVVTCQTPKHEPGKEQPRNIGVRVLRDLGQRNERFADMTHVWFLDSDVILDEGALEAFSGAMEAEAEPRILVGPYEWLPPGAKEAVPDLHNDPRWEAFKASYPWDVKREDLSAGLACFTGNLIWPLDEFERVGGFWNELHHGRCEDGELGLRAVAMGVGISMVAEARGWHLDHPRNLEWIVKANAIDVPKLNARHNWKELGYEGNDEYELFVVDEDGKRFDARCARCGQSFNTILIWQHQVDCPGRPK